MSASPEPDFKSFVCAMCGNCCRGEGFVRIDAVEGARIAAFLGLTVEEFHARYTRDPDGRAPASAGERWLLDKPGPEQECIFLEDNKCRVHPVKPQKCTDFPLKWRTPDILDYCEGMRS